MSLDSVKNFAIATLAAGIASTDTSLSVVTGQGARFPAPTGSVNPFNAVLWNDTDYPSAPFDDPNKEIVRCTARSSDTLTISRGQESTSASNHNTSGKTYKVALSITAKMLQDIASGTGEWAGSDTGSANAYVTTIDNYPGTLVAGMCVSFSPANKNTGASTLNHNGTGAKAITDSNGVALIGGELQASSQVRVRYDGTNWRLQNTPLPPTINVLNATSSEKTPGGSNQWMAMTGNKVTLTPGTWMLQGSVYFANSSAADVKYSSYSYVLATANGADSSSQPTAVATGGNITVKAGVPSFPDLSATPGADAKDGGFWIGTGSTSPSMSSRLFRGNISPCIVAVSANTDIYLVPLAAASSIGSARVTTNLMAVKLSTATA